MHQDWTLLECMVQKTKKWINIVDKIGENVFQFCLQRCTVARPGWCLAGPGKDDTTATPTCAESRRTSDTEM